MLEKRKKAFCDGTRKEGKPPMATKKVGILIKEARTAAGLTQEKLAKAAGENLTAAMISKCERGEDDLTNNQLKKIAVACGVTQSSLLNAPKNLSASAAKKKEEEAKKASGTKTGSAKKTSSAAKTVSAKKPAAKPSSEKADSSAKTTSAKASSAKTASAKTTAAKVPAGATNSIKVTATEKKLVESYREASAKLKKAAVKLLKGDYGDDPDKILSLTSGDTSGVTDGIGDMLGDMISGLLNRK